mgnify:CR=1 FL=1
MFVKKLEFVFITVIILALTLLSFNAYKDYSFKHDAIPQSFKQRITEKEKDVLLHMRENFGFVFQVPLIVTDKFTSRLYGLTSYQNGDIKIYLNKKVMRESMDYMIDSVIAHEYAHALLFRLNRHTVKADGHSDEWKQTCIKLGGVDCRKYVNQHEVIMAKMPFQ